MNSETPSKLRNGKLISKIPVLVNLNTTSNNNTEMESTSSHQSTSQEDLIEAQRALESKFNNLNSEISELKTLLTTLVQQSSSKQNSYNDETRQRRYFTTSTDTQ